MYINKLFGSSWLQESRALLALSMPIIVTQLAIQGMGFVDTTMAGQVSARDLAAIAIGGSLWLPAVLLLRGLLMALTPIIAHHRGSNDAMARIPQDTGQTLWLAVAASVALISLLLLSEPILVTMDVAPEIIPIASGYLYALAFGVPAIALFFTLNSFCEGMANTRIPMVVSIMGLLANIPINYVLIYGKLGFPALGAVGCGWATSIVSWLTALVMLAYLKKHHIYSNLLTLQGMQVSWGRIKVLLKLGLPIGITIFIEGSIFALIALLIGKLGAEVVAAHQIALNFSSLVFMIPLSLSFGITIRVGHALGQGKHQLARMRAWSGTALSVFWSTISGALILIFTPGIIRMYTSDSVVAEGAALLLVYAAIYQVSDALQASANGALRGYKDARTPMILVTIAYWVVGLPLGYILGMTNWITQPLQAEGFWIGIVGGLTLAAVLLCSRLLVIMKRVDRQSSC